MTDPTASDTISGVTFPPDRSRTIYRHTLAIRLMHWINVLAMFVLLLSGLQIFNAHPALYWGQSSHFDSPLLELGAERTPEGGIRGQTTVLGHSFDTTGVLGASKVDGELQARGFPTWLTIPGPQWLAMARRWHFFFAWLFVLNGLAYIGYSLIGPHFRRDLKPTRTDWRGIGRSIVDHALLRHPKGEAAARYNVLQKFAYLVVAFVLGPLIVLMGLAMSPRMDTVLGWVLDLVGGRQSARTIHFIIAAFFVAFLFVHLFEVMVSGAANEIRSIVTGRFRITEDKESSDGPR